MSTATPEELRQLSEKAVDFPSRVTERRMPTAFLSLAPKTSDSYPRAQRTREPLTAEALADAAKEDSASAEAMKRRTSSLSSDGSKLRFLKLGPVHWGEHQDDHKEDFHEVAVE
ncbi:hypothetical protein C8A05DRAFT_11206 [Staphylotrichum tortipilum]|uniref:Uncharacterized protein n=1 Tax=Staphylotrichum tortipilum TaxID=2831512 RepID=A0AAN6MW64_9PEZI|nr:hypothetical protein C8A05DRAFT_11235 [Staphylotrichum longicolle]KAK3907051.1 hypothetical protein C8A05DRAFT_11206 [Staphylotrichum longicolle]